MNLIFVVDSENRLLDSLRIGDILLPSPNTPIHELRQKQPVSVRVSESQHEALNRLTKTHRTALPVVDEQSHLLGIVTVDDLLRVSRSQATNELQRVGGSDSLGEPYLKIPLTRMVQKRGSWLVILFLGEMLTATAMAYFENEIAKAVVLALFVPLIISSGGNSGSQAATLVIRAMALGEIHLTDWWRVMRRELMTGLTLGVLLGAIGFLRIFIWTAFTNLYGPHWPLVGVTVGLSLIGVVAWGSLMGSMLPFILRRFGLDPATSSAPFVATLVDVTGIVIYFSVAALFLRHLLA